MKSSTASPSSLVQESPDQEFEDLDAKLKAQQEKTQKELDALSDDPTAADPSSFVEEGAPDSFADLDAKLKVRGSGAQMEIVRSRRACEVCLSTIARRRKIASRFLQKKKSKTQALEEIVVSNPATSTESTPRPLRRRRRGNLRSFSRTLRLRRASWRRARRTASRTWMLS